MEFEYNGVRYVVSWRHKLDPKPDEAFPAVATEKVSDILARLHQYPVLDQKERGVPISGRKDYDGLTICSISTLKQDAENLPKEERWATIAEGFAFKRTEDPFSKPLGRKNSFQRALNSTTAFPIVTEDGIVSGRFNVGARQNAWAAYFRVWPPRANEQKTRDKRYERLQRDYDALQQLAEEYRQKLAEVNAARAV
jgi:hypothetical protein